MPFDPTKDRNVTDAAIPNLTDNSGGTPSDVIPAVPGAYTQATTAAIVASLAAKVNAILAVLRDRGDIAT